ncbi:MAG: PhoPQ-activated protein PqaA family protein [Planctomycetaceae bacterium]
MKSVAALLLLLCCVAGHVQADNLKTAPGGGVPDAIFRYVGRPEPKFEWKVTSKTKLDAGTVYQLSLTSQEWHDIVWKHAVEIYEPKDLAFASHALLFVTGGSVPSAPDRDDMSMGLQLAAACGARVVMLHQVPNQPLFGGRKEDDLITDTWLKYLNSGDDTWPLLFPMVKSAVKTMDAVQQLSAEWDQPVEHFVITGGSKRGWTSWLTPVVDNRIVATAPIVIDVLNFRAQMKHQLDTWGEYSEQIVDYTSKGLIKAPDVEETPREIALRMMMDPYTYRKQLTLPKLLIVGTNDRYWVVDSMNLYFDDLSGSRFIRQVPNAGHGLDDGRDAALMTLAVFFRHVAAGVEMPKISWDFTEGSQGLSLTMTSDQQPAKTRLWVAHSADMDFRDDQWESQELDVINGKSVGRTAVPESGHVALYGELEYDFHGQPWSITTLVFRR